jgi:hypothetical protein
VIRFQERSLGCGASHSTEPSSKQNRAPSRLGFARLAGAFTLTAVSRAGQAAAEGRFQVETTF